MFSLLGGVALVSMVFAVYQAASDMHALREEVERQALILAESQEKSAEQALLGGSPTELQAFADQFQNHQRLAGVAIYDAKGQLLAATPGLANHLAGTPLAVARAAREEQVRGEFLRLDGKPMHILALPLSAHGRLLGAIAVFHNVGFIAAPVLRHALTSVAQTLLIVGITLLIVRWSLGSPLRHMAQWLRDLRTGGTSADGQPPKEEIFRPLTSEVTQLATSLNAARAAAEEEARLRDAGISRSGPPRGCASPCRAN